jgi:putative oxygen-independent coproporphyrinogen III oxidase
MALHTLSLSESPTSGAVPLSPPPLGLYIHLPWCLRKCPYCDFNSHEGGGAELFDRYIDSLVRDLEMSLAQVWGRSVQSVFIGGGTPNLFSPQRIDRLLMAVRARLRLLAGAEITMEANPSAAQGESADWQAYRDAGVTRVSIGVQSFTPESLQALGRMHSGAQATEAVMRAVAVFDRVNLDLMYGLPGQSVRQAMEDLEHALSLGVGHLSLYQLTLEPNTQFALRPPLLPDEDMIGEMQESLLEMLQASGFVRYEVSAFARSGQSCQHNRNYWEFGDYLGIGAGAHSKLTLPELGIVRQTCVRQPQGAQGYLATVSQGDGRHRQSRPVPNPDLPFEFMLNGLRLVQGVAVGAYTERTGRPIEDLLPGVALALKKGLLLADSGYWRPTARGLDFLNDLQALFLPD